MPHGGYLSGSGRAGSPLRLLGGIFLGSSFGEFRWRPYWTF